MLKEGRKDSFVLTFGVSGRDRVAFVAPENRLIREKLNMGPLIGCLAFR
jgi:hypothetical protein